MNKANKDTETKEVPSCEKVSSTTHPVHQPMYRESNASRLRQEIKRYVGNAPAKNGCRSKSCSPPPHKSPAPSTTPRPQSSESAFNSPGRLVDGTTPRTTSEASSVGKDVQDKPKGHVIDTRSRTLNSASATPSVDKVLESKSNNAKNSLNTISPPDAGSGYGKPLVTPLNKKLLIRRPSSSIPASDKTLSTIKRCRSPVRSWKTDQPTSCRDGEKQSTSSVASNKRNLSKTQLPAKEIVPGNRERSSHAGLNTRVAPKSACAAKSSKPSSLAQQRSNLSPRRANSADRKPQDTRSLTSYNKPNTFNAGAYQRSVKSWNSDPSSSTKSSPRSQTPSGLKQKCNKTESKPDAVIRSSASSREKLADRLRKPNLSRDINRPLISSSKAKCTNHSSKSFKPQLEDIKSSYLLLNKKNIDRNINEPADNEKLQGTPKSKPSIINDRDRRIKLLEIKQKYKSKSFWNDSKYDKIEGLNWITWK